MSVKAVIDTNVLVSSFLSKNPLSPPVKIADAILDNKFTPVYSQGMIDEYEEVLGRDYLKLLKDRVHAMLAHIKALGEAVSPADSGEDFSDPDDKVFFCTALAGDKEGAVKALEAIKATLKDDKIAEARIDRLTDAIKRYEPGRSPRSLFDAANAAEASISAEKKPATTAPVAKPAEKPKSDIRYSIALPPYDRNGVTDMNRFISENGSVVCRELLGYDLSKPDEREKIMEKNLFRTRCPEMIRSAVRIRVC